MIDRNLIKSTCIFFFFFYQIVSAQKRKPLKTLRDLSGSSVFDETELRDSKVDFSFDEVKNKEMYKHCDLS